MGSKRFVLDPTDFKKLGNGLLVAVLGAALTYGTEFVTGENFGQWTPIVVAGWSVLANVGRKWIANNKDS